MFYTNENIVSLTSLNNKFKYKFEFIWIRYTAIRKQNNVRMRILADFCIDPHTHMLISKRKNSHQNALGRRKFIAKLNLPPSIQTTPTSRHFKNDSNRLDSIQFRLPATASAVAFQIPAILFRRLCHTHTQTHTKRGFSLLRYCRLVVTTLWRFDSRFVWFRGVFKFKPRLSIQCGFSGDLASYSNRRVRDFKSEFRNGANPHPLTTAFHYRFNF